MRARTARLTVFLLALTAAPVAAQQAGEWHYQPNRDAVTQRQTDFVIYTDEDEEAALGIKCFNDGEANVMFGVLDTGSKMSMVTGEEHGYLSYRVGDVLRESEERWAYDHDNDIALAENAPSDRIVDAIRQADQSATMGFRIYNSDGEAVETVEAPVSGAKDGISRLSCLGDGGTQRGR